MDVHSPAGCCTTGWITGFEYGYNTGVELDPKRVELLAKQVSDIEKRGAYIMLVACTTSVQRNAIEALRECGFIEQGPFYRRQQGIHPMTGVEYSTMSLWSKAVIPKL